MRFRIPNTTTCLIGVGLLSVAAFACADPKTVAAASPPDPTHAAHVASGAMPPDTPKGDPALSQQIIQLQAKVTQLEASLAKNAPRQSVGAAPAPAAMPGMTTPAPSKAGMKNGAPGAMKPTGGMSGMATPSAKAMNMMGMMDKMMGMMDKMMSMEGGAMPPGAPVGGGGTGMMDMDDKMEMGGMGGGAMPGAAPAAGMSGMAMDKMEMAGMMGMGAMNKSAAGAMPQSVLPGFPGASHLYHIGATDFFLDHPQHIALTMKQQAALNKAKEQSRLAKSTADRSAEQAEQELWALTAADQPDAAKIEEKIREIETLRGDQRLEFIRAVGEASKLLTEDQRKSLTGFAPPAPAMAAPAMPAADAPPMPMSDM